MALVSIPYTFSAGAVIVASQHNACFSTIYSEFNGSITDANISGSAAIAYSKLNLTGNIINGDLSASLNLPDSKLAQITTASKVHGSSITGLASLPAGAGIVPVANLGTGASSTNFLRGDGTFATAGSVSLVSNTSISSATNSGDIAIDSTKYYLVIFQLTGLSSSDSISIRFNNDTTANKYGYVYRSFDISATHDNGNSNMLASMAQICPSVGINAGEVRVNGQFYINPQATASTKFVQVKGSMWGSVSYLYSDFLAQWGNTATVTSFRIMSSGGTVTFSGNVLLYEIKTS